MNDAGGEYGRSTRAAVTSPCLLPPSLQLTTASLPCTGWRSIREISGSDEHLPLSPFPLYILSPSICSSCSFTHPCAHPPLPSSSLFFVLLPPFLDLPLWLSALLLMPSLLFLLSLFFIFFYISPSEFRSSTLSAGKLLGCTLYKRCRERRGVGKGKHKQRWV